MASKKTVPKSGVFPRPKLKLDLSAGDSAARVFVAVWNRSLTLKEAAKSLGLKPSTAANYAARLREAGHLLKSFRKGRPRLLSI